MKSNREVFVAAALSVALVSGGFVIGRQSPSREVHANDGNAVSQSQNGSLPSFADLATRVAPAVVNIRQHLSPRAIFRTNFLAKIFRFRDSARRFPSSRSRSNVREPDRGLSFAKMA
jgi:S1-C subfamily serine protease